jgi:hypothetical protein
VQLSADSIIIGPALNPEDPANPTTVYVSKQTVESFKELRSSWMFRALTGGLTKEAVANPTGVF